MNKLNLIHFYQLGKQMRTLRDANDKPHRSFSHLIGKMIWVEKFLIETADIPFPKTHAKAHELRKILGSLIQKQKSEDTTLEITEDEDFTMKRLLEAFEQEFEHDSREINILSVPHRCAYSTTILIERGEDLLPLAVKNGINTYAQHEIQEAGRSLAFGLSTAAGFHLARAVESVLRRYYDVLSGGAARPKTKSGNDVAMQGYINAVRSWADPKVVSVLEQFAGLHRNPISHPEAILEEEEALTLVGISVSAVTSMVNDAKSKKGLSLS
jgi:hypothetical protein